MSSRRGSEAIREALKALRRARPNLTVQQYKTIKGQITSGDLQGAARGLNKILDRLEA